LTDINYLQYLLSTVNILSGMRIDPCVSYSREQIIELV
jgi:hypothetical protein